MLPNVIHGATHRVGKSQGYKALSVRVRQTEEGQPVTESAWVPTAVELQTLIAGGSVVISLMMAGQPPMWVSVEPPPPLDETPVFQTG